jgi:ribA/ribD-fused uncharacterized protein
MESSPQKKDAKNAEDAETAQVIQPQTDEPQSDLKLLIHEFSVLSTEIRQMSVNISEMKEDIKSLKEVKKDAEVMREDIDDNTSRVDELEKGMKSANVHIEILEATCANLHANSIQLDQYSRRDNLLFDNIAETENEDCSKVIRKILVDHLGFSVESANSIKIVRCHRLGKPREGSCRTIIVRFHYFGDRDSIWKKRSSFKGSNVRLSEDFPKEIVAKRNALAPIMLEARKQKMKAFLISDKLIIEDQTYTVDSLNSLVEKFNFSKVGTKQVTDSITAFYGSSSMLSNFSFAQFKSHGITFHSSEQFLFYHEALLFNDRDTAAKVLSAKTPGECKSLSRKIQNFDFETWKNNAKPIMKQALMEKFTQNKACYKALEATGTTTIVEASPIDSLWGAGLSMKDKNLENIQLWKGQNWMGELLGEVRKELIG